MTLYNESHVPVLKKEVLAVLFFEKVQSVFDGTLGLGGHAQSILESFPSVKKYIACDLDSQHLSFAEKRLQKWHNKTIFCNSNFSLIKKIVQENNIPHPLIIFLDLGLCSNHVDDSQKGFSFQQDGPLKMAFNSNTIKDASFILNKFSKEELFQIIKEFGEEPMAKKIANRIIDFRKEKPFETTDELRKVVESSVHPKDKNKSLMRVFQAIRIAVNDELNVIKNTLKNALDIMKKGDRMGVISYHALEDKIVKSFFAIHSKPKTIETQFSLHTEVSPALLKKITKKPIGPTDEEILINPRARSARFRIVERIS